VFVQCSTGGNPEDQSKYSEDDILSLGFLRSPKHAALIEQTPALKDVNPDEYDAIMVVGGQGPMYTFIDDEDLHRFIANFYEAGKVTCVICHAVCVLLKAKLSNCKLLVEGKTWTGFANSEEDYADSFVGKKIQPFRIEDEARKIPHSNFIVQSRFKPFALRDGNLITGQQQYSGLEAAKLVIEALGV
jgi:putative intracellular protease/amidase